MPFLGVGAVAREALSLFARSPDYRLGLLDAKAAAADGRQAKCIKIEKATAIAEAHDADQVGILHQENSSAADATSRLAKDVGENAMRIGFHTAAVVVVSGAIATTLFFGSQKNGNAQTTTRYLPEYTADGQLLLPKNFHEWVYVGSPLTPNALNGGMAGFPEFHNVYIEPGSYEIYKKTGQFTEGTIFFKELQLTLPGENPDGSRTEPSGRGYFLDLGTVPT